MCPLAWNIKYISYCTQWNTLKNTRDKEMNPTWILTVIINLPFNDYLLDAGHYSQHCGNIQYFLQSSLHFTHKQTEVQRHEIPNVKTLINGRPNSALLTKTQALFAQTFVSSWPPTAYSIVVRRISNDESMSKIHKCYEIYTDKYVIYLRSICWWV